MNKIIFTSPILKYPPAGGPELRAYNSILALSKIAEIHCLIQTPPGNLVGKTILDKTIFLFPNNQPGIVRKILNIASVAFPESWKVLKNSVQSMQINKYAIDKNIEIIWFAFGSISFNLIREVRRQNPNLKIICDTDSVWSEYILRQVEFESDPKKVALVKNDGHKKQIEEKELINICDVVTAVSEFDKRIYQKKSIDKNKIQLFPNVINPEDYMNSSLEHGVLRDGYIYMSGTFWKGSPMEDAARWLIKKVMPMVWVKKPDLKLLIIGKNADVIFSEFLGNRNIIIKGWVKSTVQYLKKAKLSLVPLRYESGTRFKILEAGICSVPVVSTKLGAEGLDVKNGRDLIIANTPKKFAESIILLLSKPKKAKRISKNLQQLVKNKYTIKTLTQAGLKILKSLD